MIAEFGKRAATICGPGCRSSPAGSWRAPRRATGFSGFRKTLGDLTAEYHYDQLTDILRGRGMGRYTESHEGGRAFIADGMEVKRNADIPMSELDRSAGKPSRNHDSDICESASVAHIYGQNLVAAESLTAYSMPGLIPRP